MKLNKLTNAQVQSIVAQFNREPTKKLVKHADGGGLSFYVYPTGRFSWVYRYRLNKEASDMTLGYFPVMTLAEAREDHQQQRQKVRRGINPVQFRKNEKQKRIEGDKNTFGVVALAWLKKWSEGKGAKSIQAKTNYLKNDFFPVFGSKSIDSFETLDVMKVHQKIAERGTHVVNQKAWAVGSQVFQYAISQGLCKRNPYAGIRFGAAFVIKKTKNQPRLGDGGDIPIPKLRELLRDIDSYKGSLITSYALRILAYGFVRSIELMNATWDEVNLDTGRWIIPAARMKKRDRDHIIDMPTQMIEIMRELKKLAGRGNFILPSSGSKTGHMNPVTPLKALYQMGYKDKMTQHGFRGVAATQLSAMGYDDGLIERQLSHKHGDNTKLSYFKSQMLPERKAMLQEWANYLDAIKLGAEIIPINARVA